MSGSLPCLDCVTLRVGQDRSEGSVNGRTDVDGDWSIRDQLTRVEAILNPRHLWATARRKWTHASVDPQHAVDGWCCVKATNRLLQVSQGVL